MVEVKDNKLLRSLWVLLAVIILLSAAFGPQASAYTTAEYYANAALFWTNVERERNGLPAFKTTDALMKAAGTRSGELVSSYSHTRPNGKGEWSTIFANYGITLKSAAENVARGQKTPYDAVYSWMQSSGHRANILNTKYTFMGVGYTYSASAGNYKDYWEELFAGRVDYPGARSTFYVAPTGLSVDKSSLTLPVGGTAEIISAPAPAYATAVITCTSSNTNVVKVTDSLVNVFTVKGMANGRATLTVKCGSYSKTVNVTVGSGVKDGPYYDVSKSDFFCDAVVWASQKKITTGVDADHFAPYNTCTRGQAVTFIWRAAGSPEPTTTRNPFVDVQNSGSCKPYYKAILWAVENGITNGFDPTHFKPSGTVTREQFVTFLWRQFNCPKVNITNPFVDVIKGQYYYDAVMWAYKNGITNGFDKTHFGIGRPCQRYQVVMFLKNALT